MDFWARCSDLCFEQIKSSSIFTLVITIFVSFYQMIADYFEDRLFQRVMKGNSVILTYLIYKFKLYEYTYF